MTNALLGLVAKHRCAEYEFDGRSPATLCAWCICGWKTSDGTIEKAVTAFANHVLEAVLAEHGETHRGDAELLRSASQVRYLREFYPRVSSDLEDYAAELDDPENPAHGWMAATKDMPSRRGENPKADGSEPRDEDAALAQDLTEMALLFHGRFCDLGGIPARAQECRDYKRWANKLDEAAARLRGAP